MGGEDPAKGSPKGSGSKGETAGFFLNCIEKYTPDTEYQERPLDKIYDAVIDGAVGLGSGALGHVAGAAKDAAHLTKAERKAARATSAWVTDSTFKRWSQVPALASDCGPASRVGFRTKMTSSPRPST